MPDSRSPPPPPRRERSRSRSRDRDERPRRSERDSDRYEPESRSGERHHRRRTRSRSRSRSRSPGRPSHSYRHRDSSMPPDAPPAAFAPPRSLGGPFNAPAEEAAEFATRSVQEHRVYVGNLSYEVRYKDLEQFMKDAGLDVAFTEILLTPNGMSKGCGIVEFSNKEDATRAISEFTDKTLLGRPVFIREDREQQARFGAPPSAGRLGAGGFGGGIPGGGGRQIYVGNLPFQANWQDLKDLFRPAGAIIRADIQIGQDGRPKGSGTVVYESVEDAQNAIAQFNGFEWFGRRLEVREDRFAFAPIRGGFRGRGMAPMGLGMGRGGFQGRGGFGGAPGGFGGGFGGGFQGGFQQGGMGGYGGMPAVGGYGQQPYGASPDAFGHAGAAVGGAPSKQILVNNLPWSTSNEDLVELFETTGEVVAAEILMDPATGRSRGQGVVEFVAADQSTTATAKFTGYMYGGRPLEIRYNPRFHQFTPGAGRGGVPAEM